MAESGTEVASERAAEALLFVPTILEPAGGTEAILRKLAGALSAIAPSSVGTISLKSTDGLVYGPDGTERARRWTLESTVSKRPVYDVIEVCYRSDLSLRDQGRALKLLRVALASWWLAGSLLNAARELHRKSLWQRLQVAYIAAFTLSLGIYLVLLARAAAEALLHQIAPNTHFSLLARLPKQAGASVAWNRVVGWFAGALPGLTVCRTFIDGHLMLLGGLLVAGALAVGLFSIPDARESTADGLDAVRCRFACWLIAMKPWRPHVRARYVRAAWSLVALVLVAGGTATAPRWLSAALAVASVGLTLAGFALRWLLEHTNQIVAVMTVLGITALAGGGRYGAMMDLVVAGMDYGRVGTLRADVTGRLLEAIRAALRDDYQRVHVIGHAFGGIVALDTLFYTTGNARTGALEPGDFKRIGDLVTIAPPITFVQQLFPRHFDRIRGVFPDPQKHQWINVSSPLDILGTPILDEPFDVQHWYASRNESRWAARVRRSMHRAALDADANPGDPNNIRFGRKRNIDFTGWYPLDVRWFEMLSLPATRAHDWYWNLDGNADFNAFARIVSLLNTAPAFAAAAPTRNTAANAGAAPQDGWEPGPNSVWLRGGGIRDGSPMPPGAYCCNEVLCRPMPVVEYYCGGAGDLKLRHDVLWPPWVGVPARQAATATISHAAQCVRVDWSCDEAGRIECAEPRKSKPRDSEEPARWRPHLHRLMLTVATVDAQGCIMLSCDRHECFTDPRPVHMQLYRHNSEAPRSA